MYSKQVMDHFLHPRNKGKIKNPDAVGRVGNPICGDVMYISLKIKEDRIESIGWETMGCAAAIATSSMLSEIAKGETLDEAIKITKQDIADALEGLPKVKMHCSNLAAEGLRKAIHNYRNKDRIIDELMRVFDRDDAESLFREGITSIEELKKASIESIAYALSDKGIKQIKQHLEK